VHLTFLRQRTESKVGTSWGLYGDAIIEGSFSPGPSLIVFGIYPTVRRKSFVSRLSISLVERRSMGRFHHKRSRSDGLIPS